MSNVKALVQDVANELQTSTPKAHRVFNAVIGAIAGKIAAGEKVSIHKFGSFKKTSSVRRVKAPMMSEAKDVKVTRVSFTPSKTIKR